MKLKWAATLLIGAFITSCGGSASVIRREPNGGTLALKGNHSKANEAASKMMTDHCGGPYQVVLEERVTVGQRTEADATGDYEEKNKKGTTEGTTSASESTVTKDIYEYQISYSCVSSVP